MSNKFILQINEGHNTADITNELYQRLSLLENRVDDITYLSFQKVIEYYKNLKNTPPKDRNNELYGLTSIYALLLLSSTYDVAIKEIFKIHLAKALYSEEKIHNYIGGILNKKILNRYLTNIKHNTVKETFHFHIDENDIFLQQSIGIINDLIKTRNDIAHGLDPQSKGHNDLLRTIEAVLYYLNCYSINIENNFF